MEELTWIEICLENKTTTKCLCLYIVKPAVQITHPELSTVGVDLGTLLICLLIYHVTHHGMPTPLIVWSWDVDTFFSEYGRFGLYF